MRSILRSAALVALGSLIATLLFLTPASADIPAGSWTQYPSGSALYQAAVQQPINTANTSNWSSKSKGAIPVMFKLQKATGPAVFESIGSDTNTDNDFAFMSFTPASTLLVKDVTELKASYDFSAGDCHGGSLRWQLRTSASQTLFIYYGDAPNFTDCTTTNQSGVNMVGFSDLRYDTSQYVGGTFYDTYAHAMTLMGDLPLLRASLVLDSGWGGDQQLKAGTTGTVNGNTYTWNPGGDGVFSATCDLPAATIQVSKLTPTADGSINEEPVQASLVDGGNAFRVVDCKYQYVLSIPSLKGAGGYQVEILIDGNSVPTPGSPGGEVKFDLK